MTNNYWCWISCPHCGNIHDSEMLDIYDGMEKSENEGVLLDKLKGKTQNCDECEKEFDLFTAKRILDEDL